MIIDCIADLHGFYPTLEGNADLLIIAGDLVKFGNKKEYHKLYEWLLQQKYEKIVLIAGNHDKDLENDPSILPSDNEKIKYLCDSGIEFKGLQIWGSPYTPAFYNWHFMRDRGEAIKKHWDLIPKNTNILITHGPPWTFLDKPPNYSHLGCMDLLEAVSKIRPKLHVFGHIHECYGKIEAMGTQFVNCSHVNEYYEPINAPIRIKIND